MRHLITVLSALVLYSLFWVTPTLAEMPAGTSTWYRGGKSYANKKLSENIPVVDRLQGQLITKPVIVQPQNGRTVVSGNMFVNDNPIVNQNKNSPAAMLHLLGPKYGGTGQVLLQNNRLINRGPIISIDGKAGMSVLGEGSFDVVESINNHYINRNQIEALD